MENGGASSQAGAVRLALSRAMRSFVDTDMVEKMRLGKTEMFLIGSVLARYNFLYEAVFGLLS